jgi:hypothetical protein
MNAIYAFVALAGGIILIWVLGHVIGGHTGSMDPLNFFFESSTMGTILVLVVWPTWPCRSTTGGTGRRSSAW